MLNSNEDLAFQVMKIKAMRILYVIVFLSYVLNMSMFILDGVIPALIDQMNSDATVATCRWFFVTSKCEAALGILMFIVIFKWHFGMWSYSNAKYYFSGRD